MSAMAVSDQTLRFVGIHPAFGRKPPKLGNLQNFAQLASRLDVMELQAVDRAAGLATPAVALKNFAAESPISVRVRPQARAFGPDLTQGRSACSRGEHLIAALQTDAGEKSACAWRCYATS